MSLSESLLTILRGVANHDGAQTVAWLANELITDKEVLRIAQLDQVFQVTHILRSVHKSISSSLRWILFAKESANSLRARKTSLIDRNPGCTIRRRSISVSSSRFFRTVVTKVPTLLNRYPTSENPFIRLHHITLYAWVEQTKFAQGAIKWAKSGIRGGTSGFHGLFRDFHDTSHRIHNSCLRAQS